MKSKPTFDIENEIHGLGYRHVVGVDECGRGPGAGPVGAAAVKGPLKAVDSLIDIVNDSKKLSESKRKDVCGLIISTCEWGLGTIDNRIIDQINILEATKLAMRMALSEIEYLDYA